MTLDNTALLILRLSLGFLFLYPLKDLLKDFTTAKQLASFVFPYFTTLNAFLMLIVMFFGSLMLIFGIYAQIAAIILAIYSLLGIKVHYALAKLAKNTNELNGNEHNKNLQALAITGHLSSGQKNIVIFAACLVIFLVGSGNYSLMITNLWS